MSVANKGGWLYIYDRASHKLIAKTEVSPHENVDAPLTREGTHHCPGIVGGVVKTVSGIVGDVVKILMLPAGAILLAGGLVLGLIAGLFLGLLRNNTARSGTMARGQLPTPPAPRDGARRPRQNVWKRR